MAQQRQNVKLQTSAHTLPRMPYFIRMSPRAFKIQHGKHMVMQQASWQEHSCSSTAARWYAPWQQQQKIDKQQDLQSLAQSNKSVSHLAIPYF